MIQHILALFTVTIIVGWGVYRVIRFFRNKGTGCQCGCCGENQLFQKKNDKKCQNSRK